MAPVMRSLALYVLVTFLAPIDPLFAQVLWLDINETLDSTTSQSGTAWWNNEIHLIGGRLGSFYCTVDLTTWMSTCDYLQQIDGGIGRGSGQWYAQADSLVYLIGPGDASLNYYDLTTRSFVQEFGPTLPKTFDTSGCLAHSDGVLFLMGGGDPFNSAGPFYNTLYTLNIAASDWIMQSNLSTPRASAACVAYSGFVWLIGGVTDRSYTAVSIIEHIAIANVSAVNTWTATAQPLSVALLGSRAVVVANLIYVVGGYSSASSDALNIVHVIDPSTEAVTALPGSLAMATGYAGVVAVDSAIYVLGGEDMENGGGPSWQVWVQMYDPLATSPPSQAPTGTPTIYITDEPTRDPTISPTEMPSIEPTKDPTMEPITPAPTVEPTLEPTEAPQVFMNTTSTVRLGPTSEPTMPDTGILATKENRDWLLYGGIGAGVLVLILCVVGYFRQKKWRARLKEKQEQASEMQLNAMGEDELYRQVLAMSVLEANKNKAPESGIEVRGNVVNGIGLEMEKKPKQTKATNNPLMNEEDGLPYEPDADGTLPSSGGMAIVGVPRQQTQDQDNNSDVLLM